MVSVVAPAMQDVARRDTTRQPFIVFLLIIREGAHHKWSQTSNAHILISVLLICFSSIEAFGV
jgi:hypothetical protein